MYDDTNDETYGEDFIINYNIISMLPAEYDMVSEVSEAKEDFMPDETVGVKNDVPKTTFRCPGALGTYKWIVIPFGLNNAGATYQRAMNAIFHDFIENLCRRLFRFPSTQERHRDQPKQNKTNFGSQASIDKATTSVFVGEDKLLEKIYIKSKWQDEGVFATTQDQKGK
ncbi:uncharacterized protein LOC127096326 [Lathyrus oleraceus]|uniref:uncharacterized protein LOC127096326 n=1 Tax=Pisum sativum TaxID=3888 RepID=UPI0021D131F6|nr:uncharacterized protein LOC127096326 [Pisum sativum]